MSPSLGCVREEAEQGLQRPGTAAWGEGGGETEGPVRPWRFQLPRRQATYNFSPRLAVGWVFWGCPGEGPRAGWPRPRVIPVSWSGGRRAEVTRREGPLLPHPAAGHVTPTLLHVALSPLSLCPNAPLLSGHSRSGSGSPSGPYLNLIGSVKALFPRRSQAEVLGGRGLQHPSCLRACFLLPGTHVPCDWSE